MIVLGIDPGLRKTGYGLIENYAGQPRFINSGIINLETYPDRHDRLYFLYESLNEIIEIYSPSAISLEMIFTGRNIKSAFMISEARAVSIISGKKSGLKIYEYSARAVKQGITGYGNASKEDVKRMVKMILNIKGNIKDDASDALALAIYHVNVINILGKL
ncbi:MAG: crossover junction endodeoxyribonuclease RuvC [Proteobacteria bacterium]|nr:crossover junction endodeoxyribonuclease RuvC [Pseudomonadota bacterium]